MSLADEILSTNDRPFKDTEAWGKPLRLIPMSGIDREEFDREKHAASKAGETADGYILYWRARYLIKCLHDRDGNRVFTPDQAKALSEKNGETLKRLWDEAEELNGLAASAVSGAAKNS